MLKPRRRHTGKSITRGHKKGLVDQCFSDVETYCYVRNKFEHTICTEVKSMYSESTFCTSEHFL